MEKKKIKKNEKAHTNVMAAKKVKDAWTQLQEKTLKDRGDNICGLDKQKMDKTKLLSDQGDLEYKLKHGNELKRSPTLMTDKKPPDKESKQNKNKDKKADQKEFKIKVDRGCNTKPVEKKTRKKLPEKLLIDAEKPQKPLNLAERKQLRDKYTFKTTLGATTQDPDRIKIKEFSLNSPESIKRVEMSGPEKEDGMTNAVKSPEVLEVKKRTVNKAVDSIESSNSEGTKTTETEKKSSPRKPIIKTVTYNGDTKIYKAVTFIDQKHKSSSLKIRLPVIRKCKPSLFEMKSRVKLTAQSKASVKVESKEIGKKTRHKRKSLEIHDSPLSTEVARWAPNSVNSHTKLYYDAWLNKALTPVPRSNEKDPLVEENIIRSFKEFTEERPLTPDISYDYNYLDDERYTGKIKITQR